MNKRIGLGITALLSLGLIASLTSAQSVSVQADLSWQVELLGQQFECTQTQCRKCDANSCQVCTTQGCYYEPNQPLPPDPVLPEPNQSENSATQQPTDSGSSTQDTSTNLGQNEAQFATTTTDVNTDSTVDSWWFDNSDALFSDVNVFFDQDAFMERVCGNLAAARCSEGACPNTADGRPQLCQRSAGGCGCAPINPPPLPNKKPQCSDGIDNDYDKKIDYPSDAGCVSQNDNDEKDVKAFNPISKTPPAWLMTLVKRLAPGGSVPPGLRVVVTWGFKAPGGAINPGFRNFFAWLYHPFIPGGFTIPAKRPLSIQMQFNNPGGAVAAGLRQPRN